MAFKKKVKVEEQVEAPAAPAEAPAAGPMTALAALTASGTSQAVAVVQVIESAMRSLDAPEDQVSEFCALIAQSFAVRGGSACEPYYKIQSVTAHGHFYAIGRKFTAEPSKVLVKDLTPAQIAELSTTSPKFISSILVTSE